MVGVGGVTVFEPPGDLESNDPRMAEEALNF